METVTEIWADTGNVVERPMSVNEQAQRQADEKAAAEAAKAAEAQETLRESARNKISAASGLTTEEMRALGLAV